MVCEPDDAFERFAQWKLDVGLGCKKGISVVSNTVISTFDPTQHVGQPVTRVVGALRPVNIGSFHVWIIYPRGPKDLVP